MNDESGAVFEALADPTRRYVIQTLAVESSVTATQLAGQLPMTRQAAAKHLAVLADAGLVTAARDGRETRYRLVPERLETASAWLAEVGAAWDARLAALRRQLGAQP